MHVLQKALSQMKLGSCLPSLLGHTLSEGTDDMCLVAHLARHGGHCGSAWGPHCLGKVGLQLYSRRMAMVADSGPFTSLHRCPASLASS